MDSLPVVGSYWEVVLGFGVDGLRYRPGMVVQVVQVQSPDETMVIICGGDPPGGRRAVRVGARSEDHMSEGGLGWYLHTPVYFGRELRRCKLEDVALLVLAL